MIRKALFTLGMLALTSLPAQAQAQPYQTMEVRRSGPRYGAIWLSSGIKDSISVKFKNQKINSTMSLFGWEFQRELLDNPGGVVPVASIVGGVAGLDQGLVLPSVTWIVGMRTSEGIELGLGPNVSLAGAAFALTSGITFKSGALNIPMHVTYVSSRIGTRLSMSTGFNIMK